MNDLFKKINEKSYLGFTIFDIIHFVGSLALLIYLFIMKPKHWELYCAECFVAIVFSVLLIAFIIRFAKKTQTELDKKVDLNFAFLVATASMLVPETFFIATFADVPKGEKVLEIVLFICVLVTIVTSFIFFLASLFHVESEKWGRHLTHGMLFFALASPLLVAYCIAEGGSLYVTIVRIIISLAPLFPFGFVFAEQLKKKNQRKLDKNGDN